MRLKKTLRSMFIGVESPSDYLRLVEYYGGKMDVKTFFVILLYSLRWWLIFLTCFMAFFAGLGFILEG